MSDDIGGEPYTVAQMIAELQNLPPDMRIVKVSYEGYSDASAPVIRELAQNIHDGEWFDSEGVDGAAGCVKFKCAVI
jgi:hypothetical protein